MKKERYLNVDIEKRIAELKEVMKEFILKQRLYQILIRGKGLEFDAYRDYSPDDDAQNIDWKASKRANKLLVRQYRNERNLKIIFAVDVGKNMVMGSAEKLKCEYATEVVAALANLVVSSGDRVGFLIFSDDIKEFSLPLGGFKGFDRLVDRIRKPETYEGASDVGKALDFIYKYVEPTIDSVVIVSDFVSFNEKTSVTLSLISKKFETLILMIRDPMDYTLPEESAEFIIEDPKTGQQLLINPKIAKRAYEKLAREQEDFLRKSCLKNNVDLLKLNTTQSFVPFLLEFLKGRAIKK